MARIRSIHPGQWTDEAFVSMSFPARLLALAIRNEADDQGVFEWKPLQIKMRLFPADNIDVPALLDELVTAEQVRAYSINGKRYGHIRNFDRFQKPRSPSNLYPPPPDPDENTLPQNVEMNGVEHEPFPQSAEEGALMEEGIGEEVEKEERVDARSVERFPPSDIAGAVKQYNETAARIGLPLCEVLNTSRRKKLKARLQEVGATGWRRALSRLESSPFCQGKNDRGWRASFDFLLQPESMAKLLEGAYEARGSPAFDASEFLRQQRLAKEASGAG